MSLCSKCTGPSWPTQFSLPMLLQDASSTGSRIGWSRKLSHSKSNVPPLIYDMQTVMGHNIRTDQSPLRSPNLRVFIKPACWLSHTMPCKMAIGRTAPTIGLQGFLYHKSVYQSLSVCCYDSKLQTNTMVSEIISRGGSGSKWPYLGKN